MEKTREKVWYSTLQADLNQRYFTHLASKYYDWDLYSKIFLAIMSSGVVAGWIIWKDPDQYPWGVLAWKLLSALAAGTSVILPIVNPAKKLDHASKLKNEWAKILNAYELLWLQVDSMAQAKVIKELEDIQELENKQAVLEVNLPTNEKKLIRQCQQEVKHARGLE